jgi:predicted enzyme related to lactoylglutathione lyase
MNEVIHFEIPAADTERAKNFYSSIFGWRMTSLPEMNYTMVATTEADDMNRPKKLGAINGGMMKRTRYIRRPVITISVENIEAILADVNRNGGSTLMEKFMVADMGWSAYFRDTEGNPIGLWQNNSTI